MNIRETIENAAKEISERDSKEVETPEKEEIEKEEPEKAEKPEKSDAPEKAEEVSDKVVKEDAEEEISEVAIAPVKEVDKTLVNPPTTWTAKGKSLWNTLSEDARREVLKREGDIRKGIEQYKSKADFGDRIERALQPYQPFLRAKNANPERVVQDALNLAYQLETSQPKQKGLILKAIGQQYGADFSVLTEQSNPETDKFNQVLMPIQQELEALKRERQNSLLQQKQQQSAQLQQTVESFASATDDTGQLLHPYFSDVKDLMASLLESNRVSTLDQAYTLAVQADPEISKLVSINTPNKISAEAKARADKAQRNDKVVAGKKPSQVATSKVGSMRDTIDKRLKELQAT